MVRRAEGLPERDGREKNRSAIWGLQRTGSCGLALGSGPEAFEYTVAAPWIKSSSSGSRRRSGGHRGVAPERRVCWCPPPLILARPSPLVTKSPCANAAYTGKLPKGGSTTQDLHICTCTAADMRMLSCSCIRLLQIQNARSTLARRAPPLTAARRRRRPPPPAPSAAAAPAPRPWPQAPPAGLRRVQLPLR